jgi:hypothetical protein
MIRKTISDGSTWPRPALESDDEYGLADILCWKPLADITQSQLLEAATIIQAYEYLVMESTRAKRDLVCRDMREGETGKPPTIRPGASHQGLPVRQNHQ